MLVVFHSFLGAHSLVAADHFHKRMALLDVDYAGLDLAKCRENRSQVILVSSAPQSMHAPLCDV